MKLICFSILLFWTVTLTQADDKISVASFSTILTEIAQRVGGSSAQVAGLVKPGVDPHEFEPTPSDMKTVSDADLVLLSAKHMEGYVSKINKATGAKGRVVQVGDQFPSLRLQAEAGKAAAGADQSGAIEDPHWWHSIDNVKRAVGVVLSEMSRLAPEKKAEFAANAAAYTKELGELQAWAKSEVAKLPRNQRKLVTSHDAFGYFARDFGFAIYPIEGVTPEDQPSSKKVAELIATIRKEGVKSIFLESIENPKVATEITRESGAKIGGTLYADGLGEKEAATYAGMYRHNVEAIVSGLK